jgi:hypothetical protein
MSAQLETMKTRYTVGQAENGKEDGLGVEQRRCKEEEGLTPRREEEKTGAGCNGYRIRSARVSACSV